MIIKSDSGRGHGRKGLFFFVLVGMQGNFEGLTFNRVGDGSSRGGGRKLCKETVGWIVDLNKFLASCWWA